MFYDIDFTKKAFDNATRIEGEAQTEYRVKGKAHLRLIVYQAKKALVVRGCFRGNRKSKTLGYYPIMRLSTFERLANEFCERLQAGSASALAMSLRYTDFFIRVYIECAKAKDKKTWDTDLSRFKLYIEKAIGQLYLADIKAYHIQALLNNLPKHLSDRSHDLIRALISVSFSVAIKYELVDKNPCLAVPAKNNCNAVERVPSQDEVTAFLKAALIETDVDSDQFSIHCLCLLLALFTGIRIENSQTARIDMLSADGLSLFLPDTKPKKSQRIYLSEQARWVIAQARKVTDSSFLFPSTKSKTGHIGKPRTTFIRICKRAKLACNGSTHEVNPEFEQAPLTIHSLRKAFGSFVLNATSDMEMAKTLLGHSNIAVTRKHYAFHNDERLLEAVNVTSDALTQSIPNFPRIKNTDF